MAVSFSLIVILSFCRYKGDTLIQVLDSLDPPVRDYDRPFRFVITDVFKNGQGGLSVAGKVTYSQIMCFSISRSPKHLSFFSSFFFFFFFFFFFLSTMRLHLAPTGRLRVCDNGDTADCYAC